MAWNEPGGSGDKDPWGSKGGEQGPPDLDEVVRKLQRKFGGVFGGGGGKGGTPGGGMGAGGIGLLVVGAIVLWGLSGLYIVDEGMRAVVQQFGAYHKTERPGLHWYPRFIQSVETVDVSSVRNAQLGYRADEALVLTQDENIIDVKFDIQYHIKDTPEAPRDYLFNVRNPDETLRQLAASATREVIGRSTMDFVITEGRSVVTAEAHQLLQNTLDSYQTGLQVQRMTMQEAKPPQQVKWAFDDVVKAREDEQRYKNQAETYSNEILPQARGEAARMIEEANAYKQRVMAEAEGEANRFSNVLSEYKKAPDVTRKRLYLDTMESVLSKSSKVIIDAEGGNNLLYLPLDRLMQRSTDNSALPSSLLEREGMSSSERNRSSRNSSEPVRESPRGREVR